ncbi:MAG: UbiX family flavin prenyltransferase [Candidatus Saliniplasma sp.]
MKLLLAITGASGVVYGKKLLDVLSQRDDVDFELVISESGKELINQELQIGAEELKNIADVSYESSDMSGPPASGSSLYDAVLIVPCSMSTLSKISTGIADNLITRSASVALKENRKLILVPRETPLSTTSLRSMYNLSVDGAVILPAAPGFYGKSDTIEDLVNFIVGKVLDNLGLDNDVYERWE